MWVTESFQIKEDNLSQRNCKNQSSHPSLSYAEPECQAFDSKRDSHSTKFEQRTQIIVKLSFRELSGLHPFDNMAIIQICQKQKGRLWVHETPPILEIIFVNLTENSSVIKNDNQGPQKYQN